MTGKRIAFVLRTKGLEYDDRVRKEALALTEQGAKVFIFVNFNHNEKAEGVTSYGIPYKAIEIKSIKYLPNAKYLLIKALEFYLRLKNSLKSYDIVWAHEEYTFMFPLFANKNKCIWDLHEIPFRFQSAHMKPIFHYIENKCKKLIHANESRINFLINNEVIKRPHKHCYLNNFADKAFFESNLIDNQFVDFEQWLDGDQYVYLQGLTVPERYPLNSIELIMNLPKIKAVVVGDIDGGVYSELLKKYGDELLEKVYFHGMADQLCIPAYVKSALFSIILYDTRIPNNRYCEPNRLYQSLMLKVPVIVGCNEPMASVVSKYGVGFVLNSDGRDYRELELAAFFVIGNIAEYKAALAKVGDAYVWNNDNLLCDWYS